MRASAGVVASPRAFCLPVASSPATRRGCRAYHPSRRPLSFAPAHAHTRPRRGLHLRRENALGGLIHAQVRRFERPQAAQPLDPAQLPRARPPALPARVDPPRDPAVLHRGRQRGDAVLARDARGRVPARQGRERHARARHAPRRQRGGLRVDQPLHVPGRGGRRREARARRRPAVRGAVRRVAAQHLRDELRRALGLGGRRAQPRRGARRLRAQHGRGRHLALPPRGRRRHLLEHRRGLLFTRGDSRRRG